MKHILKDKLFVFFSLATITVGIIILVTIFSSLNSRRLENQKVEQLVNPVSYENVELETVLQEIVNSSSPPIQIGLCKQLAKKRVTLKLRRPLELKTVLKAISLQLDCNFHLFSGNHAEIALPVFDCIPGSRDLIYIEKKKL